VLVTASRGNALASLGVLPLDDASRSVHLIDDEEAAKTNVLSVEGARIGKTTPYEEVVVLLIGMRFQQA
jgi:hypothetical protein